MKRIVTLLLAAGLVLGAAAGSQAADIKAKGTWQNNLSWADRAASQSNENDNFRASTRLRTQIDVIASENLKGVVFFEIGHQNWGVADDGAALGNDGKVVKVRYSYVDWVIPQTSAQVRIGLQPFGVPTFAVPMAVLDTDGAGITVSGQFTENVGAALFWLRPYNTYDYDGAKSKHDAMDVVGLTVPLTFDGVKVTPFGMYSVIGQETEFGGGGNNKYGVGPGLLPAGAYTKVNGDWTRNITGDEEHGNAWWAGITGELTMFDPFRVAADFAYGSVDMGEARVANNKTFDVKRAGWYAALSADYKMDFMTPGLVGWYASGDDDDAMDGSERMPVIDSDVALTSYGFDGGTYNRSGVFNGTSLAGTWGILAQIKDISFVEDLTHVVRFGYIQGTNHTAMVGNGTYQVSKSSMADVGNDLYLTTKDGLWEVNIDSQYNIYKDLSLCVELGYINLDYDESIWGNDTYNENNFKAAMSLNYKF
jgi:putative uncharacterized protein LI0461